jgi:hypothetical protein
MKMSSIMLSPQSTNSLLNNSSSKSKGLEGIISSSSSLSPSRQFYRQNQQKRDSLPFGGNVSRLKNVFFTNNNNSNSNSMDALDNPNKHNSRLNGNPPTVSVLF